MATIENFILKFKTEGTTAIKGASEDLKSLAANAGIANNSFTNLAGGFKGVAAVGLTAAGVFAALGIRAINLADELQDLSDATGVSASKIMSLRQSMIEAGGGSESYQKALTKLSVGIGEAMGGNEKYQKSFKDLGVFVTDASGQLRDSNDILDDVIKALGGIEDPAVRAAKATELLGKEAAKIDWSKVRAGKDAVTDEQIAQLSKYREAIDALKTAAEKELVKAFGNIADAINKGGIVEGIAAITEELGKLVSYIPGFGKVADLVTKARMERLGNRAGGGRGGQGGPTAKELADYEKSQQAASGKGGFGGLSDEAKKAIEESNKRIAISQAETRKQEALRGANEIQAIEINSANEIAAAQIEIYSKERLSQTQKDKEFLEKKKSLEEKAANDIRKVRSQLNAKIYGEEESQRQANAEAIAKQASEYAKGAETARLQVEEIKKGNNEFESRLALQQRISGLSAIDADRETKFYEARLAAQQQIDRLKLTPNLEDKIRLKREKEINAELERRIELITQESETRKKNNNDFSKGVEAVVKKYEEMYTPLAQGQMVADSVFGNMERSIDNFVSTGKFKFGDFAASVVQDMIKIELKALASTLLRSLLGNIFGIGQFTPGSSTFVGPMLPGRAQGGPTSANMPYIVGERGPELFIPNSAGTVVPSGDGAAIGMGATTVNYNIQAVDASSFRALVARDPQFIYSVTEKGRRSQPNRRYV